MKTCNGFACEKLRKAQRGEQFLIVLDGAPNPLRLGGEDSDDDSILTFICFSDSCITFSFLTDEGELQLAIINCEEIAAFVPLNNSTV